MGQVKESDKDNIKNYENERNFLSGLLKYPESIYEFESFLSEEDLHSPASKNMFKVLKTLIIDKSVNKLDAPLILATISNLNLVFPHQVNVTIYVNDLFRGASDIEYKTVGILAKDIKLMSVRREVWACGSALQKKMINHKFGDIHELLRVADEIYESATTKLETEEDIINIGENLEYRMNKLADNPIEHLGFSTGFKYYDKEIGRIREDSFNFIAARAKVGKSMLAMNIARNVAEYEKLPVFYCDSEMDEEMFENRLLAHVAGVDIYYIETGRYKQNPEICAKVEAAMKLIPKLGIKFHSIRGKSSSSLISACRRFLFKNVKRNQQGEWNKCLFIWDYIKLDYHNNNNMGSSWWLDIARSTVLFKDFLGSVKGSAIVLGQTNASGISKKDSKTGKMFTQDDESTVAGSDEINKTATSISLLRYKTNDEKARDGLETGDMILMPFLARTGPGGSNVMISAGVWEKEYISLARDPKKYTFTEKTTNSILREKESIRHAL